MKRILIIIAAIICLCLNANAQMFFGGKMAKYSPRGTDSQTYISFAPTIGYQYHKLALGMDFSYQKYYASYDKKECAIELFPFIRYYFFNKNKLSLFIEADYAYSIHKIDLDNYSYHKNERYHAVYCSPGIQYQLSPQCAVVAFIGLIGYSDSYWYGFKDFGCTFGLSATSLSFYYYFWE
jgi:hypothetical protein